MAQMDDKVSNSTFGGIDETLTKKTKHGTASPSQSSLSASWLVGDVVWAKIPGHPWWPSMLAYDPNNAIYFQYKGRARYYHVQFFGQDPVRGWASERSVIKFDGLEQFESSPHAKNHRVTVKRKTHWETAVKFAEKALPMNRLQRQLCYTFKYYDKCQTQKLKDLNGISVSPLTADKVIEESISPKESIPSEPVNDIQGLKNDTEHLKIKQPKKRKRKQSENDVTSPKKLSNEPKPKEKPAKHKKKMRKNKKKDVIDVKPEKLNLQNGLDLPLNGNVSPNSALKLKIRKVKSPVNPGKSSRKGKTPKETFIIVNDHQKQIVEQNSTECNDLPEAHNSPPEVTSTSVINSEERPKRRKKRKLDSNFITEDTELKMEKPKVKRKYVRKKPLLKSDSNDCKKDVSMTENESKDKNNSKEKVTKVNEVTSSEEVLANNKLIKQEAPSEISEACSIVSSNDSEAGSVKGGSKKTEKDREAVCVVCEQFNDLIYCEGGCFNAYHPDCIGLSTAPKGKFICDECTSGIHSCFICRQTGDVKQCSQPMCSKFYHIDCVKSNLCARFDGEKLICPLHSCVTCVVNKTPPGRGRMIRCVRCPTAYHLSGCLEAGCMPITPHYMVCSKHFVPHKNKAHHSHVNVNWCFVCSIGGTLICCEKCPAAFHPECISYEGIPDGHFYCKDCNSDKALLYGDIVWVKLGMYRWWPAQICNPRDVPTNIQSMRHQPGEFPVMFLGSHDYYWIHKGRVFSYQDGDKGTESNNNKYLEKVFKSALVEAKEKYAEWKKAKENKAEQDLQKMSKKPAPFKHIKVNKCTTAQRLNNIDLSDMPICECSAQQEAHCGPDCNCLNRMLQFECTTKCPALDKCQNQRFVKREYAELEPYRALNRGWGLKTKQDIRKGAFVIEYVGELIDEATCLERVKKGDDDTNYYMLTIDKDCIIDAGPMGNLSRFMNHSCNPNCETQKWTVSGEVRVGLFASRDIVAGEEITFDYRLDCRGNEKKKCHCGASNCSGFLGLRPKTQSAQMTEDKVKKATKNKRKRTKKTVVKEKPRKSVPLLQQKHPMDTPSTTDAHTNQSSVNSEPNGLSCDSPSSQVKFTGSSPLNSVLPWNFETLQVLP